MLSPSPLSSLSLKVTRRIPAISIRLSQGAVKREGEESSQPRGRREREGGGGGKRRKGVRKAVDSESMEVNAS